MNKGILIVLFIAIAVAVGVGKQHTTKVTTVPKPSPTLAASVSATPTPLSISAMEPTPSPTATPVPTPTPSPTVITGLSEPIAEFKSRITKKNFGTYITPATSPVQPERFQGYHTGVDVEYADVTADVPVYAVLDSTVVISQSVSGYGGLLVLKGFLNGQSLYFLYGHLRLSSLPAVGASVKQGQKIGVLGTGNSQETDGERRHLHFAVYTGATVDIKGYVQTKAELSAWKNPLDLFS